jgi:CheY-like chemotaxis protein
MISNALKFTLSGGVKVISQLCPPPADSKNSSIEIHVSDTGIGLSEEQRSRLFQPFMQADSSTTRKFGGSGLGLNLSKKLAQALGGDLILSKSQTDVGSTFTFSINVGEINPMELREVIHTNQNIIENFVVKMNSNVLAGMKILLVEDSLDNQLLFSMYLDQVGASVDIGNDGLEGIALARKNSYDVILMDVQMPNLDGFGATAALRKEGFSIPIVALTAHAMADDRDRALASGFSHYLTKPLDSKLLIQTLSSINSLT